MSRPQMNSLPEDTMPAEWLLKAVAVSIMLIALLYQSQPAFAKCPTEGCVVAAGKPGSLKYALASVIASETSEQLGMNVRTVESAGGYTDVMAVNQKEMLYTITSSSILYSAINGKPPFKETQKRIRMMGNLYTEYLIFLTTANRGTPSGIKTIGIPPRLHSPNIKNDLKVLGFPEGVQIKKLAFDLRAKAVRDGELDSGIFYINPNSRRLQQIISGKELIFVRLNADALAHVFEKRNAGVFVTRVSADLFPEIQGESFAVAERIVLVTHEDDDDDCNEDKMEIIYSKTFGEKVKKNFPDWIGFDRGDEFGLFKKIGAPFHAGSERFWKNQGMLK